MKKNLKVAIVHDWLIGGGAERVVYELHQMFPDAPIYTSYCTDEWRKKLDGKVVTGWLQHLGAMRKFIPFLRIWWFTHLDFSGYDLVISSTGNGEAKGIRMPKGTMHICYCHTPTHFYWRQYSQYLKHPGFGWLDPLARLGLGLLVGPLRRWDLKASKRPDYFIANSTHIQQDIKTYYGREAVVIHPPVDVSRFMGLSAQKRRGFVTVGRQVPAKHTDIIVAACTQRGTPLTVVGQGPEHERLKKLAGPSVTFAPPASDTEVARYMARAEAFLFASLDDFGITPIEAIAAGTPVIAYKAGGALDYVHEGKTGLFFLEQTAASLAHAIEHFDSKEFKPATIRASAAAFAPEVFRRYMQAFIEEKFASQK
ncbi:MAG TPA: glycosyltransferase [Candidatus Saccharimonadales bacterium]|nr:glycosyltransferase [Candidatus Saccharimonadales bacterium]